MREHRPFWSSSCSRARYLGPTHPRAALARTKLEGFESCFEDRGFKIGIQIRQVAQLGVMASSAHALEANMPALSCKCGGMQICREAKPPIALGVIYIGAIWNAGSYEGPAKLLEEATWSDSDSNCSLFRIRCLLLNKLPQSI